MTLRVLISGASGFIGQALCEAAARRGFAVRGGVRRRGALPAGIEPVEVGEINGDTDWSRALCDVDVVICLAARVHVMKDTSKNPLHEFQKINVSGAVNLARQSAGAGIRRLVYVSSIKVNGEETSNGSIYSEEDTPTPQDPYGISKWEAEQALHRVASETGLEVVIVRPPLVYGAGVKGNFAQMLRVVARGIPLPFGSVRNRRDLIYIGNFVDALIACAIHPAAAGQTYLVSDGAPVSTPDLLRMLADAMGVPSRVFPFPPALLKVSGKLIGKSAQVERLLGSLQVDSGNIRRELNWQPPYSMQQGLQATVDCYRTKAS